MRRCLQIAPLVLLLLLASCAAPKDSYKNFPRPKYEVRTKARNGTPSVRQTWWSKGWFWQRTTGKKRTGKSIRLK